MHTNTGPEPSIPISWELPKNWALVLNYQGGEKTKYKGNALQNKGWASPFSLLEVAFPISSGCNFETMETFDSVI